MDKPIASGRLTIMGSIETVEADGTRKHPLALLIEFDDVETIRQAISDGECKYNFGGD